MSKPDWCSQDVWNVASELAYIWCHEDYAPDGESEMAGDIARVILAAEQRATERAAAVCKAQAEMFLSPEYASNQPLGSITERFACDECAKAILSSPSQGVTDAV